MVYGADRQPSDGLGPVVGRPRGAEWRALQADGIVWEGQVLLVGDGVDLAARLIVTHRRLAFVRGGSIALDLSRSWLRPAPRLLADQTLLLSVSAPGASIFSEPEEIPILPRDGAAAARQLIAMLAGSGARPVVHDAPPSDAGRRRALPPLPDRHVDKAPTWEPGLAAATSRQRGNHAFDEPTATAPRRSWEKADAASEAPRPRDRDFDANHDWRSLTPDAVSSPLAGSATAADRRQGDDDRAVESAALRPVPPVAVGRDRDWNLEPIKGLVPRSTRRRRGWSLRIGGLFALLGFAAWLGVVSVGDRSATDSRDTAADRQVAAGAANPEAPSATTTEPTPPGDTAPDLLTPAEQTAIAVGVGGGVEPTTAPDAMIATEIAPVTATSNQEPTAAAVDPTVAPPPTSESVPPPTIPESTEPATEVPAEIPATDVPAPAPTATATATATAIATATATQPPAATTTGVAPQADAAESEPRAQAPTAASAPPTAGRAATSGALRFRVEQVDRGTSLSGYGLAGSGANEWVAVIVSARNWAGVSSEIAIDDVRLESADGQTVATVDGATTTVAQLAGIVPAYGRGDTVPMPTNAEQDLALAFLVPAGSGDLVLRIGDAALALDG